MYKVKVQPMVNEELVDFAVRCTLDHGAVCANDMLQSFEKTIKLLEEFPQRGVKRLQYLPSLYRAVTFWKHKWLIYQIDEAEKVVYIDYLIDDRSNYGALLK